MMTIKHIGDDGREKVVSVVSVHFDPQENTLTGVVGEAIVCTGGYAYVMNDAGKTVGTYNLRKSEQQKKQEQTHGVSHPR